MFQYELLRLTLVVGLFSFGLTPIVQAEQECYIQGTLCFDVPEKRTDYLKDDLLLLLKKEVPSSVYQSILQKYGLDEVGSSELDSLGLDLKIAKTNGKDPLELSRAINRVYEDLEAATNNIYTVSGAGTLGKNHPKLLTGANKAREFSAGEGVLIGMVDGPVDINHSSYRDRVKQISLVEYNPKSVANLLHGSGVAAVMVSSNDSVGIAPAAKLLSIAAFHSNGDNHFSSSSALIAQAIDLAIKNKVDILNLSFSGGYDRLVVNMIKKAIAARILVVASCGNDASSKPRYPAAIDGVIAVTAVDHLKRPYVMANKGNYIDVAAPGVGILTAAPGNRHRLSSGTSLAAANVSGSLALLLAKEKNISRELLNYTAIDLGEPGHDALFGDGLVNVYGALKTILK